MDTARLISRSSQESSILAILALSRANQPEGGGLMAPSEIMHKIEDLSEEREKLLAREGSHHAGAKDHRRLEGIDHALGVLWDLRRREMAGDDVRLDEDYLDRYVISPGDDAPDDYASKAL